MKWGDQWNNRAMDYLLELGPNSHFEHLIRKLSKGMCLILGAGGEVSWIYKSSENIEEIVGINISREELQKIDKKIACLIVCDAQNLPFKDSCFNVIICKSTLHHLTDVNKGILECN
ncbi:methyltransferase domain-containing protein [Candidatus Bathyarchaeota archaeon]|nr:methyltransferase domain-containing protein [Candidatus Bathyarchaeota archaeon]